MSAGAKLMGIGVHRASRVVPNSEIVDRINSTDEWIRTRSGIVERRWANDEETVEFMATNAAREAIAKAGIDGSQIDLVIIATVTHFLQTPSLATKVAHAVGSTGAAFDISAACAGFCYGLAQAESLVRSGAAKYAVVIGVEELSRFTDIHDRSTAFLFADGAGAAVVGPSETNGIGPVVWGSDGSQADAINQTSEWSEAMQGGTQPYIAMDGRAVFKWASGFIADATKKVLEVAQLSPEELDVFIPHQANNRITDAMLRHLKLPENVVVARTIKQFGNNSAASVPMAMDQLLSTGQAKSGQTALLIGFGAGLVYAGQVVTLP